MTEVLTHLEFDEPDEPEEDEEGEEEEESEEETWELPAPRERRARPNVLTLGTAMTILGVLLLGFVVDVGIVGGIRHDRDRQVAYEHLRYDLANATAPTGALDANGARVAEGRPVAVMEIKEIGLREVVSYGSTAGDLMTGPGLRRDTVMPGQVGNSVILGRRFLYGGPFRYLNQLIPDSTITVTTGQGVSNFKVVGVRHPGQEIPPEFTSATAALTLITSDGSAWAPTDAIRVYAVLSGETKAYPAGPTLTAKAGDKALATDRSAWIPLVFWIQALVIVAVAATWLRSRWGVRQSWLVSTPVLVLLGLAIADTASRLLPNVM